ncbi:hypothetical protein [Paenibacillus eucommiae]|uniref:Uncharacterized protein n=1 Tax=Paenibacillus eucommiae TaxID=1355755 RepID=A0ABS4J1J6_9BACL|nr:hypothetical protein [Paenibacillus eucommiae]MBP1993697.1 hypothetical protein [Paenibacillus eucommiae]
MKVFITVKSLGKKKNDLSRIEWQLIRTPETLRAFITDMVTENVKKFNSRQTEVPLVPYLTGSEIEQQGSVGKVGFGTLYNEQQADSADAVHTAILAHEDGLYKVFINGEEIDSLDEPLLLEESADVAFIRFTMLAGRLW